MSIPLLRPSARRARALTLAFAAALAPGALAAQTVITGVVVDSSLATARPLPGATVQLVNQTSPELAHSATTDSSGNFLIDGVRPGRYVLGFIHPRLDELAIQPPMRLVVASDTVPVVRADLAVPNGRVVTAAFCGARTDSTGLLMGRVLDAERGTPVDTGEVLVSWTEIVVTGGLRQERRTARAAVGSEGRFAICGVPSDAPMLVQATAGARSSGDVELQIPALALLQRDLLVAPVVAVADTTLPTGVAPPRRGTARLTGRVRSAGGGPMGSAVVLVHGSGASDTTDATGAFAIDGLPAGTFTLEARAIGYIPQRTPVDLAGGRTASADVTLADRVPTLEAVTVYGTRSTSRGALSGFLERSRAGFGHFLDPEEIQRRNAFSTSDLLRTVPGVRVTPSGSFGSVISVRGATSFSSSQCLPDVFVDGMWMSGGATELDRIVTPQNVAAMEIYTGLGGTPAEYQRGSCGSIVVWTKGRFGS